MWIADKWKDYELIDCGGGERLERWGGEILIRPDPQAIWNTSRTNPLWGQAGAKYHRSETGGGHWEKNDLPENWSVEYGDLTFHIKPMNFKHTGLFPEQAVNWDFVREQIARVPAPDVPEKPSRFLAPWSATPAPEPVRVLNLFAYTGGATVACAKAGASVCHVDAAKGMVAWAKENARLSGLSKAPIRWIVDDCVKFVEREIRRGRRYDAIIMDPPSYGRGPNGEVWKIEDQLYDLINVCVGALSERPLFFLISSYTAGLAPSVTGYLLNLLLKPRFGGTVSWDEIGLPVTETGLALPCGSAGRWVADL